MKTVRRSSFVEFTDSIAIVSEATLDEPRKKHCLYDGKQMCFGNANIENSNENKVIFSLQNRRF
jgi:hypothetical protein